PGKPEPRARTVPPLHTDWPALQHGIAGHEQPPEDFAGDSGEDSAKNLWPGTETRWCHGQSQQSHAPRHPEATSPAPAGGDHNRYSGSHGRGGYSLQPSALQRPLGPAVQNRVQSGTPAGGQSENAAPGIPARAPADLTSVARA